MFRRLFGQRQNHSAHQPETGTESNRNGSRSENAAKPGDSPVAFPCYAACGYNELWALDDFSRSDLLRRVNKVKARARTLSRGAKRLLLKVHSHFEHRNFEPLRRADVAAAIQHPYLYRHDLKLLQELVASGFVQSERVALPKQPNGYGRGAEWRYSMGLNLGWLIRFARNNPVRDTA